MTPDAREPDVDDAQLVERSREGDDGAFGTLVSRHHEAVFRLARRMLGEDDPAADATQDAFLKAYRSLEGFRGDAAFRTWVMTIAANEARVILRRRGRRRETGLENAGPVIDEGPDVAERVVARSEVERARACVDLLPEKQRLAVTLRLEEGLSFREVGELIGSSEGAARVNYHHGVKRLREMLAPERDER